MVADESVEKRNDEVHGVDDPTKVVRNHTRQWPELNEPKAQLAYPAHVKVRLNSRLVKGESVQLKHGDRLIFRPNKKIRFRARITAADVPVPAARGVLPVEDELKENVVCMADVLGFVRAAVSDIVSSAVKFYGQLRQDEGCNEEHALMLRDFLEKLKELQQQVKEANEITREVKGEHCAKFGVAMDSPPLAFGHGKVHRAFPDLLIRKATPVRKTSRWCLVKNRLHTISGHDNVDPLEYFKAERAREASVSVRVVFTFENEFAAARTVQHRADKATFRTHRTKSKLLRQERQRLLQKSKLIQKKR